MYSTNRGSGVGGWRADMLELETYFIWGQKVLSDWWISGNKHYCVMHRPGWLKAYSKKPGANSFQTKVASHVLSIASFRPSVFSKASLLSCVPGTPREKGATFWRSKCVYLLFGTPSWKASIFSWLPYLLNLQAFGLTVCMSFHR